MPELTAADKLSQLAHWIKESAGRLRIFEGAVRQELAQGHLPNNWPQMGEAETFLVMAKPMAPVMLRLAKALEKSATKARSKNNARTARKRK